MRPVQAIAVVASGLIWLWGTVVSHHTLQAILICSNNQLHLVMYYCTYIYMYTKPLKTVVCNGL